MIKTVSYAYSWLTTDGEVLGYIIGVYHVISAFAAPILIVISHTVYPSVWLKLYVFMNLFFVFIQHIILNICVLIPVEEKLTKQKTMFYPMLEKLLEPFHISIPNFITYIVIAEGIAISCFGLEILSIISRFAYKQYGIDF